MPIHDWTLVEAGIFYDFHQSWIQEIKHSLNSGLLPEEYYALAEQFSGTYNSDVLALTLNPDNGEGTSASSPSATGGTLLAPPPLKAVAEAEMEFYRRKQNILTVRHISGDEVVAVVEVVSPGSKSSRKALADLVAKSAYLLDQKVHLLILDLFPPGPRDPRGIHGVLWEDIEGDEVPPPTKPLTLAAYEVDQTIRAYVEYAAVGENLPAMPLFLEPRGCIMVPLDATYQAAFQGMPKRWRTVLEPPAAG